MSGYDERISKLGEWFGPGWVDEFVKSLSAYGHARVVWALSQKLDANLDNSTYMPVWYVHKLRERGLSDDEIVVRCLGR